MGMWILCFFFPLLFLYLIRETDFDFPFLLKKLMQFLGSVTVLV